jgi:hypothetical protein
MSGGERERAGMFIFFLSLIFIFKPRQVAVGAGRLFYELFIPLGRDHLCMEPPWFQ